MKAAVQKFRELAGHGMMQNVMALMSVQFFRKILPLLTIPYLARVLGPASWGLVAVFQSLAMCTELIIEFGFTLSATRQIARSRHSGESVAGIFAGVMGAQMVLSVGGISAILLFRPWVPILREHPTMLASCLLWAVAEGINPTWYFLGLERMKIVATLEICSKTLAAVAMFALVHSPADTGIVLALQAIAPLVSIVAALSIVYRDLPFQLPSIPLVRDALVTGWPMFVMRSAESIYTLANAFVLGLFAGPMVVGYFAGPEKISRALVGVFNPVRETLYPRISKLVHTSPAQAARLARIGMLVTGSGGLLLGVIVFLTAPFLVKIVLGAQFAPAVEVLRMFAILPPLISITQSVGMQWLLPLGKEHAVTRILVVAGVLNLVLAVLLVPKHTYLGMAAAVICAEAFVSVCLIYVAMTDRDHRMPLRRQASEAAADFAVEYEAVETGSREASEFRMTAYQPIAEFQRIDAVPVRASRWFPILVGLALATGTVVLFEPAPYDIALILLFFVGLLFNKFSFVVVHRVPILLLIGYFMATVISLSAAPDLPRALAYVAVSLYLALSWLCFTGVACATGKDGIRVLVNGYIFAGYFTALLSVLAFFHWIPYQSIFLRYGRAQGFFKDPNVYGPYLVLVLLLGFSSLQHCGILSLRFAFGSCVCVVTALGVFLSFSRAAWTNTAVSLVVFLTLQFAYGLITRSISAGMLLSVLGLPVFAGLIAVVALSGGSGMEKMLMDRLGNNGLKNYDSMRFYTQGRALDTVKQQPLGIGPGQSEVVFDYSTHNMYIRVLVESGALGFAAFYAFVLASFLRALKMALTLRDKFARDLFAVVTACLLGLFINGLVIDTIHWRHLWFLLALAWWVPQAVRSVEGAGVEQLLEEAILQP